MVMSESRWLLLIAKKCWTGMSKGFMFHYSSKKSPLSPFFSYIRGQNSERSREAFLFFSFVLDLAMSSDSISSQTVIERGLGAERQTHTCISSLSLCGCSCFTWGVTIAGWGIPVVWGPGGPGIMWCENLKEKKQRKVYNPTEGRHQTNMTAAGRPKKANTMELARERQFFKSAWKIFG